MLERLAGAAWGALVAAGGADLFAALTGGDYAGLGTLVTAVTGGLVLLAREFRRTGTKAVADAQAAGNAGEPPPPPADRNALVALAYEVGVLRRELEGERTRRGELEAELARVKRTRRPSRRD